MRWKTELQQNGWYLNQKLLNTKTNTKYQICSSVSNGWVSERCSLFGHPISVKFRDARKSKIIGNFTDAGEMSLHFTFHDSSEETLNCDQWRKCYLRVSQSWARAPSAGNGGVLTRAKLRIVAGWANIYQTPVFASFVAGAERGHFNKCWSLYNMSFKMPVTLYLSGAKQWPALLIAYYHSNSPYWDMTLEIT